MPHVSFTSHISTWTPPERHGDKGINSPPRSVEVSIPTLVSVSTSVVVLVVVGVPVVAVTVAVEVVLTVVVLVLLLLADTLDSGPPG
jgi:hypothetical protein